MASTDVAASVGAAFQPGHEQVTARQVVLHLSQIEATRDEFCGLATRISAAFAPNKNPDNTLPTACCRRIATACHSQRTGGGHDVHPALHEFSVGSMLSAASTKSLVGLRIRGADSSGVYHAEPYFVLSCFAAGLLAYSAAAVTDTSCLPQQRPIEECR
jgi:hypothetical protein